MIITKLTLNYNYKWSDCCRDLVIYKAFDVSLHYVCDIYKNLKTLTSNKKVVTVTKTQHTHNTSKQ